MWCPNVYVNSLIYVNCHFFIGCATYFILPTPSFSRSTRKPRPLLLLSTSRVIRLEVGADHLAPIYSSKYGEEIIPYTRIYIRIHLSDDFRSWDSRQQGTVNIIRRAIDAS